MSLRINTNVASINARRDVANTPLEFDRPFERLGSGLRLDRAAADAAGQAISENLKSDIRALEQSARKAADGISLAQVAEGALDEVNGILVRLRELARQAASETLGASERGYLDDEFQALSREIDRISETTGFNGTNLLDGSGGTISIQVGLHAADDDRIGLDLGNGADTATLGVGGDNLTGADNTNPLAAIGNVESAINTVGSTRLELGAFRNRLESTIRSNGNAVANLSAANSRIRDVARAAEFSNMASSTRTTTTPHRRPRRRELDLAV